MLPAMALSAVADWRAGFPPMALLVLAGWGVGLAVALAFAADRGPGPWHAALWLCGVPGAALLAYARTAVGSADPGLGLGAALAASPLVWCLDVSRRMAGAEAASELAPLAPLALAFLLAIAALVSGRETRKEAA